MARALTTGDGARPGVTQHTLDLPAPGPRHGSPLAPAAAPEPRAGTGQTQDLWLAIAVPELPLLAHGSALEPAVPAVVVAGSGSRQTIWRANARAAQLGVSPGMSLGAAHSLLPSGTVLRVFERDEGAERRLLERLAWFAMRYSPVVSITEPDGVVLEIAGSLKLFGGVEALAKRIGDALRRRLDVRGIDHCVAVAPTASAARVLAQTRRQTAVTEVAALAGALAGIPVTALSLSARESADLERIGVGTLGACLRLPRGGLARRLSPALLRTLDRLTGRAPNPLPRVALPDRFRQRIALPAATADGELLEQGARQLLAALDDYLALRCAGTQRLVWRLTAQSRPVAEFTLGLAAPERPDARHRDRWSGLFSEALTRHALTAPADSIELVVANVETVAGRPAPLLGSGSEDEAAVAAEWNTLLDRLAARLGEDALGIPACRLDHRPERAFDYRPRAAVEAVREAVAVAPGGVCRPLWLCHPAKALTADTAHRPHWGGPLRLVSVRERIEAGWWEGEDSSRDYYVARNPLGEHCWVCRVLPRAGQAPSWYLQGIFE